MLIRKLARTCAVLAAVSPLVANATSDKVSAKACAHAFANSIAVSGASAPMYKLDYHDTVSSALSAFYPTDYTFTLEARDPKTGAAIARASCTTDYRGVVTSISVLPVGASAASLAARF